MKPNDMHLTASVILVVDDDVQIQNGLNVIFGQATAGGGVQKTLAQQEQKTKDKLRVLYRTPKVAPYPVAVYPRVPIKSIGIAHYNDYLPLQKMGLERFYLRDQER